MAELALAFELSLTNRLGWPNWSLRTIACLSAAVLAIASVQFVVDATSSPTSKEETRLRTGKVTAEFRWFQLQYLSAYLIIMLADWLQGTNMYTLYSSYGVDVGTLFLTGFLSSAVFGTFLGIYVDKWGRKLGCIIFCVLEIVINLLEHIPSMPALMFGRVLGGLSTSLLFSAFESWMVSEHRKRGFPEELLASTFAISSWGNGVVAIMAGVFAQLAAGGFVCRCVDRPFSSPRPHLCLFRSPPVSPQTTPGTLGRFSWPSGSPR